MIQTRRAFLGAMSASAAVPSFAAGGSAAADWSLLAEQFTVPDWFRDAKLGLWSHWGPQCVPEFGDWYGRLMYVQGHPAYDHHLRTYGHPARFGFKDLIPLWKADRFDPAALVRRYKAAGAAYIVSMANHHDNMDLFASRHQPWNSTRVGPCLDIVGSWEREVRKAGLRFGVSNHGAHAWHWWQTAYGYDAEGPMRGVRYDAFHLRRSHGRGRWWQGLDPQQLYTGPHMVVPDGLNSIAQMNAWHDAHDGQWLETIPPGNRGFARNWLARQIDLVTRYQPDLVYFDNAGLPLEQFGLDAAAHAYESSIRLHGHTQIVVTAKRLDAAQRRALVEDVERGFVSDIRTQPWQTCTCIGSWHYDRPLYERRGYKTAEQVIQRLFDVVSKNGNLLLSFPQRGDGSIDDQEEAILDAMAAWMAINRKAIHGSRPWRVFGEGPTRFVEGMMNEGNAPAFAAQDVRFTMRGGSLYIGLMKPSAGRLSLSTLGLTALRGGRIERVTMLPGTDVRWTQDEKGLHIDHSANIAYQIVPVLEVQGPFLEMIGRSNMAPATSTNHTDSGL